MKTNLTKQEKREFIEGVINTHRRYSKEPITILLKRLKLNESAISNAKVGSLTKETYEKLLKHSEKLEIAANAKKNKVVQKILGTSIDTLPVVEETNSDIETVDLTTVEEATQPIQEVQPAQRSYANLFEAFIDGLPITETEKSVAINLVRLGK
jgi:hypothetical protein